MSDGIRIISRRNAPVFLSGRALFVARKMAAGFDYKRLPVAIINELNANGLTIQVEHVRNEGVWYYPLHKERFLKRLREIDPTAS